MIRTGRLVVAAMATAMLFGPSVAARTQTCVAPPTDIVGWWAGNGSAADTALGNDGQLFGDAHVRARNGWTGFRFDGVGDYVEITDSLNLKPARVSVEA